MAKSLIKDHYYGAFDDEVDFAYAIIEEFYSDVTSDLFMRYFDYAAFTRDLFINDYFSVEANHQKHIFSIG